MAKPTWGAAQLARYLGQQEETQREFAERAGINESHVSKYLSGDTAPGMAHALRIQTTTGGKVPMESWLLPEPTTTRSAMKK